MQRKPSVSEHPGSLGPAERDTLPPGPGSATHRVSEATIPAPRSSGTRAASERRASPRICVKLDVSLGSELHYFSAESADLSRGGLFATTYRVLPVGSELSVEFDLPLGRVMAKGVVRWAREGQQGRSPGYGIEFLGMSHFDERLVESFCESQAGLLGGHALAG